MKGHYRLMKEWHDDLMNGKCRSPL